ncbi:MAG: hypothetical protein ACYCOO_04195 [Chitinophagaceae bacterium]
MKNLKKLALTALATIFAVAAFAQTPEHQDVKKDSKDMRNDIREVRKDRRERNYDLKHGKVKAAQKEQMEIKRENKDIHSDMTDMKHDGVKHPIKRAQGQIHHQNERHKK